MYKQTLYTATGTDEWIAKMVERGWEAVNLDEGCLTSGDWFLISPDQKKKYNFYVRERYIGAYSSGQSIRRVRGIPTAVEKRLNAVGVFGGIV